jgi:UDP-N-acetylmuramyl pentapeptide synthase
MLKQSAKSLIIKILAWESKLILKKYQPKIIAVTGNIGKTSVKDAIFSVMAQSYPTRKSEKSYNSDFGIPLTVIGRPSAWSSVWGWFLVMVEGLHLLLVKHPYPEWLVLEVGADRPGDIKRIAGWLRCDIVVMTTIPKIPVHVEFFKDVTELVEEKFQLALSLSAGGTVIINTDDEHQSELLRRLTLRPIELQPRVITYGAITEADLRASDCELTYNQDESGLSWPSGLRFNLQVVGERYPIALSGVIGRHQVSVVLAALAVARSLSLDLGVAGEALALHEPSPGRLRTLLGLKKTLIIDDSYNSSPLAVAGALETLRELVVLGRRIAVLGDMMELGSYTIEAHRQIGALAAATCDYLLVVGVRAKFIAEGAREKGLSADKIGFYDGPREAGRWLQNFIQTGDVILIKGSQSVRLERTVEEIMAFPEEKEKLLVRQDKEWQGR